MWYGMLHVYVVFITLLCNKMQFPDLGHHQAKHIPVLVQKTHMLDTTVYEQCYHCTNPDEMFTYVHNGNLRSLHLLGDAISSSDYEAPNDGMVSE